MSDSINYADELANSLNCLHDEARLTTLHCVSYRSGTQLPNTPLVLCSGWPGGQKVIEARDSISYRAPALEWHVGRILTVGQDEVNRMAATGKYASYIDQNMIEHALMRLGWAFDDLIFNSVSLLDYCAKYVCTVGITSKKAPQYDWSTLNKPKNRAKLDHELLRSVLKEEHDQWFIPLQGLRSHVIHNKSELGRMNLSSERKNNMPSLSVEYFMAEKAVTDLPIFHGQSQVDLYDGSAMIASKTVGSVRRVVNTLRKLEYVSLHDSRKDDKWCDPMPDPTDKLISES